ncbi:hypothetical protein NPIL_277891 [Nephila pilipes]|uniref:Uncharacterized protein n=1 Tax=Nephila pilipes TaxID=299642 RepID=A0A8X6TMH2_NEPPI|nr:hypothetical protein NPIL_277891 [Nephila pilipes]
MLEGTKIMYFLTIILVFLPFSVDSLSDETFGDRSTGGPVFDYDVSAISFGGIFIPRPGIVSPNPNSTPGITEGSAVASF